MGPALVARAAVPHLESGAGVMVFCSSTVEHQPRWGLAPYGVSKVALNHLVECLRAEYEEIRFVRATIGSTIHRRLHRTPMASSKRRRSVTAVIPMRYTYPMMAVEDIAAVLLDLIGSLLDRPGVHFPTVHVEPPSALTLEPPRTSSRRHAPRPAGNACS
jgi:NAD(P)-dependent dehydrogenase (short-subunit alcohol dehydrogenase family)